jgi:glycosyltransferase involved in cell wall biosynthesis
MSKHQFEMKKTLIILAEYYPYTPSEFFLDDELRVNYNRFEEIVVLVNKPKTDHLNRFIPRNAQIISYDNTIKQKDKLKALIMMFSAMVKDEIKIAKNKYKSTSLLQTMKVIFMELARAFNVKTQIHQLLKDKNIDNSQVILYSYWHDYKSLALCLLKKDNPNLTCIARAHAWDIFADRHNIPYLPFKTQLVKTLDSTYSISYAGKQELIRQTSIEYKTKIKISRLGKNNHRQAIFKKEKSGFTFCSCSNMVAIKRIHLIIDILKELQLDDIRWIHFGGGKLQQDIKQYAQKQIPHIDFEFKGYVSNNKLLDFYASNYVDLFINVSESEGIPVSIMEAISAGIPILATNVGGTSEIVHKKFGLLIDKDFDVTLVAKKIESFLLSESHKIEIVRMNAYNFWQQNYNADTNYSNFAKDIIVLSK